MIAMLIASAIDQWLLWMPDAMYAFLTVWLCCVGGCVGSFMNVVVLRMPAGISIARTGSRCPRCLHAIRWYDNVPLVSWLVLRGRCRDCGVRISLRYPLVELLASILFLVMAFGEGFRAGQNLPPPPSAPLHYWLTAFETWSIYGYHMLLLVTLTAAGLMMADGSDVPWRLFVPALVVGIAGPCVFAHLHPVPFADGSAVPGWLGGLAGSSAGLLTGSIVGLLVGPAVRGGGHRPTTWRTATLAGATAGAFLGWQAVGVVLAFTAVTFLLATLATRVFRRAGPGPWCAYLTVACVLLIANWRRLAEELPGLVRGANVQSIALCAIVVLTVSAITRRFSHRQMPIGPVERRNQGDSMTDVDREKNRRAILQSASYLPVESDAAFLQQPAVRPVRMQLELLKPELALSREGVSSTIVVFGGTQVVEAEEAQAQLARARELLSHAPHDPRLKRDVSRLERIAAKSMYYDAARAFARKVSSVCQLQGKCDYVIVTGGGPGIMEAANRGAYDVGAKSIGLNVTLPAEQSPNPFVTPELCFQFHYFAMRKMHFLMRAKALVVFPGGFGTLDELFDALTLRQTKRMQEIPIVLFGKDYWTRVIDFQFLADEGVIADEHLDLISFAETPDEAWDIVARFHRRHRSESGDAVEPGGS